jgi:hypothetical protein
LNRKESLEHQKKREAIAAKKLRVEEHLEDLQTCYFESCKRFEVDDKKDIFFTFHSSPPFSHTLLDISHTLLTLLVQFRSSKGLWNEIFGVNESQCPVFLFIFLLFLFHYSFYFISFHFIITIFVTLHCLLGSLPSFFSLFTRGPALLAPSPPFIQMQKK